MAPAKNNAIKKTIFPAPVGVWEDVGGSHVVLVNFHNANKQEIN